MAAATRATVLIVEDDAGIAELERDRLVDAGYAVIVATSPAQALARLQGSRVDLILLDYRLPGGATGLEFYSQVKTAGFDLPVILVTGFGNEATVIQALRSGVRDFVTKSLEYLDYLPEAVSRVLDQVRTESRLAESEARLAGIIESAKDAVIVVEADRRISLFNPAAERMFGCGATNAIGRPLTNFIPNELAPPDETDGDQGSLTHRLRTGTRGVRATGAEFPLEATVSPGRVAGRKFYTLVVRDVTEREQLAAERHALLARLQLQFERMPLACVQFDADLRVTDWNPTAERIFGFSKSEVLGMGPPFERLVPASVRAGAESLTLRLRAGDMTAHSTNENLTKDGRTITCEWYNTPLMDADGRFAGLLSLAQDVTNRTALEQQLRQAQKMEAVGRLAGGVAHDFNNLLTIINGYGEVVLAGLPVNDPARDYVREIVAAGERAAGLTRQLLAFSRKAIVEPKELDLKTVVMEIERMLRRIVGEDVQLAVSADPEAGAVRADPGQIEQIILNLVVNARDAMPTGGRLTIEVQNAELGEAYVAAHVNVRPGRYVLLAVTDTGCGMDAATAARVFEPFFSTKGEHGTGLGLATVHGIVTQSGGHVAVYSEVDRGTTFKVYLPQVERQFQAIRPGSGLAPLPLGRETILLVEDEDAVRALARRVLQGCGYTVLEARDGVEAVRVAGGQQGGIDLLISDVVMPRLSGREVARQVSVLHAKLKVLFLSGYTDDAVVRHGILEAEVNFLQKPFTPAALAIKVRDVLDGGPSKPRA